MATGTRHSEEAPSAPPVAQGAPPKERRAPQAAQGAGAKVRHLRVQIGLTETDLANGTGAAVRTVRRWISPRPTIPQARYARAIDDMTAITAELKDSFTARGIRQWLNSRNRYLEGRRPIELIAEGQYERVREAANALHEGYYV